ncbi:hypothetical protein K491DRAFT_698644 [Lophiostoma macrostomum CBS 122681]|uniref:Uncharacterized protein n=1 Tax=Lophiostoma macrostomum CBS 122681 TaxID=1314788 RepID=A0A6A6SQX2_9PLEO|nr:hypothetical protein K491DRAFT_698644 [Lophiostoma macrostomum CBS 122681]
MFTLNISRSPATKEYFSGHDDSDSDSTSSAYDEVDDDGFVVVERRGVGIAFLSPRLYPLSPTNSPTRMAKSTFQGTSTSRLRVGHGIETASPAADRREAARRERRDAERRHVKAADDLLGAELEDVLEGSEDERRGRAAE